jgi:hypothetical protein
MSFIGGDALEEVVEWNLGPGISGGPPHGRPAMWLC